MLKVVFDTNIYISALLFGGIPRRLILQALDRHFNLYISDEIITETCAVLAKKFTYSNRQVDQVRQLLQQLAHLVQPASTVNLIKNHPADDRILECALTANANYLVSGDKQHILPLKQVKSVKIITAQDFHHLIQP